MTDSLNHYKRHTLLKKNRRKLVRQAKAVERKKRECEYELLQQSSPSYWKRIEEEKVKLIFEENKRKQEEAAWLLREEIAQKEWKAKQEQKEKERLKRLEQEKLIREAWEEEKEKQDAAQKAQEMKKRLQAELRKEATSNENKEDSHISDWHNPLAPDHIAYSDHTTNRSTIDLNGHLQSNETLLPKKNETCMFFRKTGLCRFGNKCSRLHTASASGCTLIVRNMYDNSIMRNLARSNKKQDQDIGLELDESEEYAGFFADVYPEFKVHGRINCMWTCNNQASHLRGTVYVEYRRQKEASEALKVFNGRWYAGCQLQCQLTDIPSWREAICGLYLRDKCPKGSQCNFLHVYTNPDEDNNLPSPQDAIRMESSRRSSQRISPRKNRHSKSSFSKSPKREYSRRDRDSHSDRRSSHGKNRSRSRSNSPYRKSNRKRSKHHSDSHTKRKNSDRHRSRNSSSSPEFHSFEKHNRKNVLKKKRLKLSTKPYSSSDSDSDKKYEKLIHKRKSLSKKKKYKKSSPDRTVTPCDNENDVSSDSFTTQSRPESRFDLTLSPQINHSTPPMCLSECETPPSPFQYENS